MVFFSSRHRVRRLPWWKRLWLTPVAYILQFLAIIVSGAADRFDEKVSFEIIWNEKVNK